MERFIDKIKSLFKVEEKINPDGKYIVYDMRYDKYSPERLLYTREYLRKFNPEVIKIGDSNRLVINIDNDFVYSLLSEYVFNDNELSSVNIVTDDTIDNRVAGCVFIS